MFPVAAGFLAREVGGGGFGREEEAGDGAVGGKKGADRGGAHEGGDAGEVDDAAGGGGGFGCFRGGLGVRRYWIRCNWRLGAESWVGVGGQDFDVGLVVVAAGAGGKFLSFGTRDGGPAALGFVRGFGVVA